MQNWKQIQADIREIVLALGADEATSQQCEALNDLLTQSDRAAEYFVALLEQEASLHDATRNESFLEVEPLISVDRDLLSEQPTKLVPAVSMEVCDSQRLQSKSKRIAVFTSGSEAMIKKTVSVLSHLGVAASVVFLLLWSGWLSISPERLEAEKSVANVEEAASTQLVSMSRCIWESTQDDSPEIGQMIATGQSLSLLEGIAELEVGHVNISSASVRICGPATVFIDKEGLPELAQGLLTLRTRSLDKPLEFPTPAGEVIVYGNSSLGISVEGETTSIHVFQGSANVLHLSSVIVAEEATQTKLSTGEAATFHAGIGGGAIPVVRFTADPQEFAFTKSLSAEKLTITPAYRNAVLDSKPAIYWQFEDKRLREFKNHGYAVGLTGRLRGGATSRSFGGNRVLEFGLNPTVGAVVSDGLWPETSLKDYTVELWMKASHYHASAIIGLVEPEVDTNYKQKHGFFFGLYGPYRNQPHHRMKPLYDNQPANSLRFVHRAPPSTAGGSQCTAVEPYTVREWQHVILRKQAATMQILVNGNVVGSAKDPAPLSPNLLLVIGQLYESFDDRAFTGQIDEVALYERALTDEEVKRHYLLVKQPDVPLGFL